MIKTVGVSERFPASFLYPAGWLAWVFGKAQQQVQNRPAMLQNTLWTDTTISLQQVFAARGNYSTFRVNFINNTIDLYGQPVSGASCVAQRTELHLILSSVLTLQQKSGVSRAGLRKTRAHFTQCAGCVKTALLNNTSLTQRAHLLISNSRLNLC